MTSLTIIAIIFILVTFIVNELFRRKKSKSLPPGPPCSLIFGNIFGKFFVLSSYLKNTAVLACVAFDELIFAMRSLLDFLTSQIPKHEILSRLSKKYGDIMTVWFFTKPVIILSSLDAVRHAYIDRPGDFSDRPDSLMGKKKHLLQNNL
jgi:hypothetical protein